MNLFNPHPTPESAAAAFWYWQMASGGYWLLDECENGYCMCEGWQ